MPPSTTVLRTGRLSSAPKLIVDVINVGSGNAILVSFPNGNHTLVDCGSQSTSRSGQPFKRVQKYISSVLNGDDIDVVVISHVDDDHIAFIPFIKEAQNPQNIILGGNKKWLNSKNITDIKGWIEKMRDNGSRFFWYRNDVRQDRAPDNDYIGVDIDGDESTDVAVYVLGVNYGTTTNSQSLVLMIVYESQAVVLTGDANWETEKGIIASIPSRMLKKCTVLMPGHHGSYYSTNADWGNKTSPQVALVSASGDNDAYGHPNCSTLEIIEAKVRNDATNHKIICRDLGAASFKTGNTTSAIFITGTNGDIRYTTDGTDYNVKVSTGVTMTSILSTASALDPLEVGS